MRTLATTSLGLSLLLLLSSAPLGAQAAHPRPGVDAPTKQARIDAAQIDQEELKHLDDRALVDAVLDYPFLIDVLAFPEPAVGAHLKLAEYNGLRELARRGGVGALLDAYSETPLSEPAARSLIAREPAEVASSRLARAQIRSQILEGLMSHPAFLEPLLRDHAGRFAAAVVEKHRARALLAGHLDPPGPTLARLAERALDNPRLAADERDRLRSRAAFGVAGRKLGSCEPPVSLMGTRKVANTPRCTPYDVCEVSQDWSLDFRQAVQNEWTSRYSGLATLTGPVTKKYLCHSYAVYANLGEGLGCPTTSEPPIADPLPFVFAVGSWLSNQLINDGSVVEVFDPSEAILTFYGTVPQGQPVLQGQASIVDHSARLSSNCPNAPNPQVAPELRSICLESKWGWAGPRMRHLVGNDPYSGVYDDITLSGLDQSPTEPSYEFEVIPLGEGKILDLRLFEATDNVTLALDPTTLQISEAGATEEIDVLVHPASAGLPWSASVVQGSGFTQITGTTGDRITIQVDPYGVTGGERTARIEVTLDLPDGSSLQEDVDVTQTGPPPPVPATPQFVSWPSQHCIYSYDNVYEIGAVQWATSYEWWTSNPAISILPISSLKKRVYAESAGTSGRLYVRACNSTGCSAPTDVLLYFVDCGGGGAL